MSSLQHVHLLSASLTYIFLSATMPGARPIFTSHACKRYLCISRLFLLSFMITLILTKRHPPQVSLSSTMLLPFIQTYLISFSSWLIGSTSTYFDANHTFLFCESILTSASIQQLNYGNYDSPQRSLSPASTLCHLSSGIWSLIVACCPTHTFTLSSSYPLTTLPFGWWYNYTLWGSILAGNPFAI